MVIHSFQPSTKFHSTILSNCRFCDKKRVRATQVRPGRRAQWPSAARAGWPLGLILQSVAGGRGHLTLTESTFTEKCCFLYERHDKFMLLLLFLEDITFEINSMGHTFFFIIFNSTHHRYWCCSNCKSSSNCFHHQELAVVAHSSLLSLFQFQFFR